MKTKKWSTKSKATLISLSTITAIGISASVAVPMLFYPINYIQESANDNLPNQTPATQMKITTDAVLLNTNDNKTYLHKKYGGNMDVSDIPNHTNNIGMPNRSMPLQWKDFPSETASFALIMEDLTMIEASSEWDHWLIANLTQSVLNEDESKNNPNLIQGSNGWFNNTYGGPTPPTGDHKYSIKIYALNQSLTSINNGFSKAQLKAAMQNKILAEAEIVFWYRLMGFTYTNNYW